jgi:anti-sigma factor RsiW
MRCAKAQKLISTERDGELDEKRAAALKSHLAGCSQCQAFAADLARSAERLEIWTAPEPRWGFTGRFMARLAEQPADARPTRSWLELLRPAPVGLGAAAFCFGVILTVLVSAGPSANGATASQDVELLAGDYFDTLSEISVDQQLLALLPEAEE